jgi:hypothetical protein
MAEREFGAKPTGQTGTGGTGSTSGTGNIGATGTTGQTNQGRSGLGATPTLGGTGTTGTNRAPQSGANMGQQKQQDEGMIDKAQEQAGEMLGAVQEQANSLVAQQFSRGASSLDGVVSALRQTSRSLREQEEAAPIAQYADRAAEQIDNIAGYLRDGDVNQIVHDVERFARRKPMLFLGGALAAGLFASRFLKSSAPQPTRYGSQQMGSRYQSGRYDYGNYGSRESFQRNDPGFQHRSRPEGRYSDRIEDAEWMEDSRPSGGLRGV